MLVRRTPGWTLAEREAPPESLFFGRRAALAFLPSERELEDAAAFVADSDARARRVEA